MKRPSPYITRSRVYGSYAQISQNPSIFPTFLDSTVYVDSKPILIRTTKGQLYSELSSKNVRRIVYRRVRVGEGSNGQAKFTITNNKGRAPPLWNAAVF